MSKYEVLSIPYVLWRRVVEVITTVHFHSTKHELMSFAVSNLPCGVSEIRNGEDLWQDGIIIQTGITCKKTPKKSVQIRSYFWSVYSCVRTEYRNLLINLHIQSEYRKTRTRNDSVSAHFSHGDRDLLLTKNKNIFRYQTNKLLKTRSLFLVCKKGEKGGKSKFVTKFVEIIVTIIFM